jgi:AcrR family transcriptional regulator
MTRTGEPTTVTSEAVLDVARALSAERGYHGTAVSQIAACLSIRTPC